MTSPLMQAILDNQKPVKQLLATPQPVQYFYAIVYLCPTGSGRVRVSEGIINSVSRKEAQQKLTEKVKKYKQVLGTSLKKYQAKNMLDANRFSNEQVRQALAKYGNK